MSQQAFPFESSPSFLAQDFIPSSSNMLAYQWVNQWPDWQQKMLCVYGPEGCGKTHLGALWKQHSHADIIFADGLSKELLHQADTRPRCWVIDCLEQVRDEEILFHLYNILKEQQSYVLWLSRIPPAKLALTLKDLASRLSSLTVVAMQEPDDLLFEAVLLKKLSDKQLRVPPAVCQYLLTHTERSFRAIHRLVELLDVESLRLKRNITLPLVKQVLEK